MPGGRLRPYPRSMPLIVTGTIGIDTVSTPTQHAERILGGSCTYFSAAASFYGPVRMVAAVENKVTERFPYGVRHFK